MKCRFRATCRDYDAEECFMNTDRVYSLYCPTYRKIKSDIESGCIKHRKNYKRLNED